MLCCRENRVESREEFVDFESHWNRKVIGNQQSWSSLMSLEHDTLVSSPMRLQTFAPTNSELIECWR